MKLKIATCQFPTSSDIHRNFEYVCKQMRQAQAKEADVAHFPEACLSGYAGNDFASYRGFDWDTLGDLTPRVLELAGELKLWTILGSSHRLSRGNKPHNSLYIISAKGQLMDRYDKMFCAGPKNGKVGDLAHYTPGNHFCTFKIKGIICGVLICHEYRYPELYREYKRRGVQLMFHSYNAAHANKKQINVMKKQVGLENLQFNPGKSLPEITMPTAMHTAAACNHIWISCSNSSSRETVWPSFFMRADGVMIGRLKKNTAGVLLTEIDMKESLYDSTKDWRERAMRGVYHSGKLVKDKRSSKRGKL